MFRRSLAVGFYSLLGGLTGILVETSIAAKLGLSESSDTFYLAFTIPYIITNLIAATGQFSLVPFFSSLDARHAPEELWRGFSYAITLVFLGLSAIAGFGIAVTPWLLRGIAPGFTPAQTELASELARLLFLMIVPAGVAEIFRTFLLSQHRFALPSAAGFLRNSVVILSILATFERLESFSIVAGYLAGYVFQLVVLGAQILVAYPVRYQWTLAGRGDAFRKLRGAGTAQVGGALAWQSVVIAERMIASFLPPGSLTALNYGFKIMYTLSELLAGSVGTASLPALSRAVARKAREEVQKTFRDTLEFSLILISPATVFCLLLNRNIVQLVFERGNFTPAATAMMAVVFLYYTLSLLFFSLLRALTIYLFARHEAGVYLRLCVVLYGTNVAFDLLFVGGLGLGARGIPLGLLASLFVTLGYAHGRNLADLRHLYDRALGAFALKNLLGATLAALAVKGLSLGIKAPVSAAGNFLFLSLVCGAGSVLYLATLAATRAVPLSHFAAVLERSEEN